MKKIINAYKPQIIICIVAAAAAVAATAISYLVSDELTVYALTNLFAVPPATVLVSVCVYSVAIQYVFLEDNSLLSFFNNAALVSILATIGCLLVMNNVTCNPDARVKDIEMLVRAELTLPYCIAIAVVTLIGYAIVKVKTERALGNK